MLNRGQKNQYYDYSRIERRKNIHEPSRRLLIVFDHYSVPTTDSGDVFTVDSYDAERFSKDIPNIGGSIRATDTLDFRPRVAIFNPAVTTDKSPFDFNARTSAFNTSPLRLLAPKENAIVSQSFYLPRMDKVYLDILGNFVIEKRNFLQKIQNHLVRGDFIELATITYPAYLYNTSNAGIILTDNRRYTMRDIGIIEDRVENLERVTTLSLLEINANTLRIQDTEGRDRFKSGFFVDSFSDNSKFDSFLSTTLVDQSTRTLNPNISRNSLNSLVATLDELSPQELDLNDENLILLDSSIQKTGRALTLAYNEVDWLEQPFATKVENVNPFNIVVYNGTVQLQPEVDSWTRTVQLQDVNVSNRFRQEVNLVNNLDLTQDRSLTLPLAPRFRGGGGNVGNTFRNFASGLSGTTSASSTASDSFDTVDTFIRNEVVGTPDEEFMRSRNVEFSASSLKPNTRFYQFLDGNSAVDLI